VRVTRTSPRRGQPLKWSAGRLGVSPSHRRSTGHALRERCRSRARSIACIQFRWYLETSLGDQCQARYELGLSPLSLASIVTLSGIHVFPGEIVAMSGLGSALSVAMMLAVGTPPLPRCAVKTGWVHRGGRVLIRLGAASPPAEAPPALKRPPLTRPKVASVSRDNAPESAVAAARGVAAPSARLSGRRTLFVLKWACTTAPFPRTNGRPAP